MTDHQTVPMRSATSGRRAARLVTAALLLCCAGACSTDKPVVDSPLTDVVAAESWTLYSDLLVADHGYPVALPPGRADAVRVVADADAIASATATMGDWPGLVAWLEAERSDRRLDASEASALLQRARAVGDPHLLSWLRQHIDSGPGVSGDPDLYAHHLGILDPSGGYEAISCTVDDLDRPVEEVIVAFDHGQRCDAVIAVEAAAFVRANSFVDDVFALDRAAALARVGLADFAVEDRQAAVVAVWEQGLETIDRAGFTVTPSEVQLFGVLAEFALAEEIRLPSHPLLEASIARLLRWGGELPDSVNGGDPLQGLAVMTILETLRELNPQIGLSLDPFYVSLSQRSAADLAPADAVLIGHWGIGAADDRSLSADEPVTARTLLALDDATECLVVVEALDHLGSVELGLMAPVALAIVENEAARCDIGAEAARAGSAGTTGTTGLAVVDAWLEAEARCAHGDVPDAVEGGVAGISELVDESPGLALASAGDPRLIISSDGLPDILATMAYLRMIRLELLGCGGATPWDGVER